MRRLLYYAAAALTVVLVAFLLGGCGDGGTAQSTVREAATAAVTPSPASSGPETLVGKVVVPTNQSPSDFKRSIESRRPVVVTFYMTGPYDDNQVRSFITTLQNKYRGQVDFYTYLSTDGSKFGDLNNLLMINSTPAVVCINRQSQVQRAWTGYVDQKSIEQGIVESLR